MKGIRTLCSSDCEEVLRINSESLPGVARLDSTELERLLAMPNEHIAMEGPSGGLVGYILAFRSEAPYDGEEFLTFVKSRSRPFIYIDQIAVDRSMRRMGRASILYKAMEAQVRSKSITDLCCEVNLNPPNLVSLAFHRDTGFTQTSVLDTKDGRTVALMTKRLESTDTEARETNPVVGAPRSASTR